MEFQVSVERVLVSHLSLGAQSSCNILLCISDFKQQTAVMGLPLQLSEEEVTVALQKGNLS